ncbi:MAG: C2H2-type zinc finger protein, partial [Candidatus Thiodiazotropha endolucinida]|nr:C2H2-type zinc finger protein [Candidatus Thiodiazotropha taylori]MCG7953105.1 C2H2-type zinc finger protein [Candidatus Thiodiazotropha taylori]MCG8093821.1 C2H2-type zinc finger protein [Candidatus Thiodiazotropha endolucinida]MCW4247653.1 C2H2-type zinc finger protein [Candidatus Thiodiazotropha endolucinida]MCW4268531.1 C2H2-type zinc finger protein [Candidatus Thiodiazotropha endolucinida]
MPLLLLLLLFFFTICEAGHGNKRKSDEGGQESNYKGSLPIKKRKVVIQNNDNNSFTSTTDSDDCELVGIIYQEQPLNLTLIKKEPDESDQDKSCIEVESDDSCPSQLVNAVGIQYFSSSSNKSKPFKITKRADDSYRLSNPDGSELTIEMSSDDGMEQKLTVINSEKETSDEAGDTYLCGPDSTTTPNGEQQRSITCKLIHSGEKPFQCDNEGWKCETCGETFKSQPSLSRHKKTHQEGWQG